MTKRTLQCFAFGRPGDIQAICVDLDIAVEARTFDEAKARLNQAIGEYIKSAMAESPEVAQQLLHRRAPLFLRLKLAFGYFLHTMRTDSRERDEVRAGFDIACPA
ncbi:hypothetical protein [Hansschlegelia zhihuaiae]|uniref:Uncharacterized protein n=1 Tax=Hansschlegelia zhihuaiae TaxID=405005 RepID=A0A4Q0MNP3_9HYPH|nr:hypothetical protein [Hansschlegelia zhihuaiae]RXF75531.1 hypothetical protein EK403_01360 [Hansschlegelia zhihuaiae]